MVTTLLLLKPNSNYNSIQLGLRLDFVFPLSQQEQQEQEPRLESNQTLIGFDIKATKPCFGNVL